MAVAAAYSDAGDMAAEVTTVVVSARIELRITPVPAGCRSTARGRCDVRISVVGLPVAGDVGTIDPRELLGSVLNTDFRGTDSESAGGSVVAAATARRRVKWGFGEASGHPSWPHPLYCLTVKMAAISEFERWGCDVAVRRLRQACDDAAPVPKQLP